MRQIWMIGLWIDKLIDYLVKTVMAKGNPNADYANNPVWFEEDEFQVDTYIYNWLMVIIYIILFAVLRLLDPAFILLACCAYLKIIAFGYHFNNSMYCFLWGLIFYTGGAFFSIKLHNLFSGNIYSGIPALIKRCWLEGISAVISPNFNQFNIVLASVASIIFIIYIILFYKFAPGATDTRTFGPLEYKRLKKKSIGFVFLLWLTSLFAVFTGGYFLCFLLITAVLNQTLSIVPLLRSFYSSGGEKNECY